MPVFTTVDWKNVAAKPICEDDDATQWEEVVLELSSDGNAAGQIVMSSWWGSVTNAINHEAAKNQNAEASSSGQNRHLLLQANL